MWPFIGEVGWLDLERRLTPPLADLHDVDIGDVYRGIGLLLDSLDVDATHDREDPIWRVLRSDCRALLG